MLCTQPTQLYLAYADASSYVNPLISMLSSLLLNASKSVINPLSTLPHNNLLARPTLVDRKCASMVYCFKHIFKDAEEFEATDGDSQPPPLHCLIHPS